MINTNTNTNKYYEDENEYEDDDECEDEDDDECGRRRTRRQDEGDRKPHRYPRRTIPGGDRRLLAICMALVHDRGQRDLGGHDAALPRRLLAPGRRRGLAASVGPAIGGLPPRRRQGDALGRRGGRQVAPLAEQGGVALASVGRRGMSRRRRGVSPASWAIAPPGVAMHSGLRVCSLREELVSRPRTARAGSRAAMPTLMLVVMFVAIFVVIILVISIVVFALVRLWRPVLRAQLPRACSGVGMVVAKHGGRW